MKAVALTAHFDGEKVQFDERCQLKANTRLVVVVLPFDDEQQAWLSFPPVNSQKPTGTMNRNTPQTTCANE